MKSLTIQWADFLGLDYFTGKPIAALKGVHQPIKPGEHRGFFPWQPGLTLFVISHDDSTSKWRLHGSFTPDHLDGAEFATIKEAIATAQILFEDWIGGVARKIGEEIADSLIAKIAAFSAEGRAA